MSRLNNLHLSYLIIEMYNKKMEGPISFLELVRYICKKTGVTKDTAKKYVDELQTGVSIEGKLYKIKLYNGGYNVI